MRRLLDTLKKASLTNVTSKFYDDARHELIHETNSPEVIDEVVEGLRIHVTTLARADRRGSRAVKSVTRTCGTWAMRGRNMRPAQDRINSARGTIVPATVKQTHGLDLN